MMMFAPNRIGAGTAPYQQGAPGPQVTIQSGKGRMRPSTKAMLVWGGFALVCVLVVLFWLHPTLLFGPRPATYRRDDAMPNTAVVESDFGFDVACGGGGADTNLHCKYFNSETRWEFEALGVLDGFIEKLKKKLGVRDHVTGVDVAKTLLVDVGANVGYFSFRLADSLTSVLSIDAGEVNVLAMERTKKLNPLRGGAGAGAAASSQTGGNKAAGPPGMFDNVVTVHAAVSDRARQSCNLVSAATDTNDYVMDCGAVAGNAAAMTTRGSGPRARGGGDKVTTTTLDDVLRTKSPGWSSYDIRAVKIDVGPHAFAAVTGGASFLLNATPRARLPHVLLVRVQRNSGNVAALLASTFESGYTAVLLPNVSVVPSGQFAAFERTMGPAETIVFVRGDVATFVLCPDMDPGVVMVVLILVLLVIVSLYLLCLRGALAQPPAFVPPSSMSYMQQGVGPYWSGGAPGY